MKNQKNERGITLVALVVTIVVLLILAGITIMYVMQGNSIFNTATEAREQSRAGDVRDAVATSLLSIQTKMITDTKYSTGTNASDLASNMLIKDLNAVGMKISKKVGSTDADKLVTISADGKSLSIDKAVVENNGVYFEVSVNTAPNADGAETTPLSVTTVAKPSPDLSWATPTTVPTAGV